MIITKRDDSLVLVMQNEHGRLAGEMASHWGGGRFAAPTPGPDFCEGVRRHDEAWVGPDSEPLFNAEQQRPRNFTETAIEDHVPLYEHGVRAVQASNPYAGLLVSMHWTGLYRERWGLQAGNTLRSRGSGSSIQDAAVEGEERRWPADKDGVWREHGTRAEFEAHLWHNYELLQALDLFSLYVSLSDLETVSGAAQDDVTAVLTEMQPAGGSRVIRSVPHAPASTREDLTLSVVAPGRVTVDPFPFDESFVCRLEAHRIDDRRYASAQEAADAIASGQRITIECELCPVG